MVDRDCVEVVVEAVGSVGAVVVVGLGFVVGAPYLVRVELDFGVEAAGLEVVELGVACTHAVP